MSAHRPNKAQTAVLVACAERRDLFGPEAVVVSCREAGWIDHEEDVLTLDGIVAPGKRLKKTTPADRARTWKALAKREWRRRAYYQRRLSVLRMSLGRTLSAIDAGEDPLAAIELERAILGRPPANASAEELRGCTCGTKARPCPPHDLGISNATKGGA